MITRHLHLIYASILSNRFTSGGSQKDNFVERQRLLSSEMEITKKENQNPLAIAIDFP
jgi:hypothetical protein